MSLPALQDAEGAPMLLSHDELCESHFLALSHPVAYPAGAEGARQLLAMAGLQEMGLDVLMSKCPERC